MNGILGKVKVSCTLKLVSGLHIGASGDFAPIGAVDNLVVRDSVTKQPYIPGSSLKGKMRTLLSRYMTGSSFVKDHNYDAEAIRVLFGDTEQLMNARFQFADCFMTPESVRRIEAANTDLYLTEIKFENNISRMTGVANPRQNERVPAGAEFGFSLIYNLEEQGAFKKDMDLLAKGIQLLQLDYIGGHGTRGYGKVSFCGFDVKVFSFENKIDNAFIASIKDDLERACSDAVLSL